MRKFESQVQLIKYKVLKDIIERTINGTFVESRYKMPKEILSSDEPLTRCCIYKEREIVSQRIDVAADPLNDDECVINILSIACDECPVKRFQITEACRGCLAHKCIQVCPRDAIIIENGRAVIDQKKCIECGRCKDACPFNAVSDVMRPCKKACGSKAIKIREDKKADIDRDKCTSCGACAYKCPFGAISDRSEIIPIVKSLESYKKDKKQKVYAVVAPAIASQYHAQAGQIIAAIKKMGFSDVIEAALGADIVAYHESLEFAERVGKNGEVCMMTSCCPAFVEHVRKNHPAVAEHLSTMVSPMVAIARFIRKTDEDCKIVFIGPCTAKKEEARVEELKDAVDYVMTFEELEAMIDAYNIVVEECEAEPMENASPFGRVFARSSGVKDAVVQAIKEEGLTDMEFKPLVCNGIDEIDKALMLLKLGKLPYNFIEGMACKGGCMNGPGSLTHEPRDQKLIDKYAEQSVEGTIKEALRVIDLNGVKLHRKYGK
ncbi:MULTISPECIES: 4Fe-4S dicluster domain-containing protein [Clostridium]|uniref:[FeFe] hydrogenase, group B1/B3 n=1 Tax=Clostridium cadaveris TaxID=1529 RepID=A0A1I2PJJ5_9CLOT|nr:4Fe-4S dicluster domain-containing protein [Clostridium cadaveris]MDU4953217.1 4Fe-4S dicluster domain-containing protein [Clostridium sp.]MDM8311745.1 4Fe-4S dicluster domain-containing protein [Clostridium cadaveris]NME65982.1 4Fe-4S binding protein [Clostridium cadaveris]UFH64476.1 4Fe-4S dicluster domain-containing protein [Clostridium cadaveris]SFG16214.1 [FeFe] hydrogenase, group B1/B3 [Clostridium cadaveris]